MTYDFDVLIAGAGPAGCLAARDIAGRGYKVGLFDSNPEGTSDKPIIIEIEKAIFAKTNVKFPSGDDIPYTAKTLRVFSPKNVNVFSVPTDDAPIAIYQDRFNRQLLQSAVDAGALYFPDFKAVEPFFTGSSVTGVIFNKTADSSKPVASAKIVIDATGFNATLVKAMSPEAGFDFPENPNHILTAECRFHEALPEVASEAVKSGRHGDDELQVHFGPYGVYSTVFSFLSTGAGRAYILIGYKNNCPGVPPIHEAVDRFRNKAGWFGRELHGGSGPIRIRHSLDRLVSDGFMVIGDAACQVIPVHGSGVASGLWAGSLAAKTAVRALERKDFSTASLWSYPSEYQRGRGKILAGFDVGRLAIDLLTVEQMGRMLDSGIMTPDDFKSPGIPELPPLKLRSLPKRVSAIVKNPSLLPKMIVMGLTLKLVTNHYSRYPEKWDERKFREWAAVKKLMFSPYAGVL